MEILVCSLTRATLVLDRAAGTREPLKIRSYSMRNAIPIILPDTARYLDET